jgi:GT2 family glycosyltransferase
VAVRCVIPCWNAEKWIARAIQRVIDQKYPDLEIIVIDDASINGSLASDRRLCKAAVVEPTPILAIPEMQL